MACAPCKTGVATWTGLRRVDTQQPQAARLRGPAASAAPVRRACVATAAAAAPAVDIISFEGTKIGEESIALRAARPGTASAVVHRGLVAEMANRRAGTASTLTRAEVRGGGRKPYKQKGTGQARRGSETSPLIKGGGVSFGPKPKDWSVRMNRKEKKLAISTALASAAADMIVVEDFSDKFSVPKTKEFVAALRRWGVEEGEKALLVTTENFDNLYLSARNVETVTHCTVDNISLYNVLYSDKIVVTKSALEHIKEAFAEQSTADQSTADES